MYCTRCELHRTAKCSCVPSRGSDHPLILFVGEASGKDENREGQPFVGRIGKLLDELMQKAGMDPSWCRWSNIVRCIPWEDVVNGKVRAPTEEELDACCMYLEKEIMQVEPAIIVPLGNSATYYFTGEKKITKLRGRRHVIELPTLRFRYRRMLDVLTAKGVDTALLKVSSDTGKEKALLLAEQKFGYKDAPRKTYTMYPTMHPAACLYGNPTAERDILTDLNYLVDFVQGRDSITGDYKLLTNLDEMKFVLTNWLDEFHQGKFPCISYDVETTSLKAFDLSQKITTFALTPYAGMGRAFAFQHHESPFCNDEIGLKAIKGLVNTVFEHVPVIGHNLKFDYRWSYTRGIYIRKVYDDTELAAWTLFNDTSEHGLEVLTSRYTDLKLHKQEMKEAQDALPKDVRYNTDYYDIELVGKYNNLDVDGTLRLCQVFRDTMQREGLLEAHEKIAIAAFFPTVEMEVNGCALDGELVDTLKEKLEAERAEINQRFDRWGFTEVMNNLLEDSGKTFKLSSADSKSILLFDLLGLEPTMFGKTRKDGSKHPSTNKKVIQELMEDLTDEMSRYDKESAPYAEKSLSFQVLEALRDYSATDKLYTAYVKGMPKHRCSDGFIRPEYGIRHTATGRYNCKDPSLQVIPWHSVIKQMFVTRFKGGVTTSADASQMELRVLAMVTRDDELVKAYNEDRDLHRVVAARLLSVARGQKIEEKDVPDVDRRRIKTVNFGIVYGRGAKSIAAQEGISVQEAQTLIDGVLSQFPAIGEFVKKCHNFVTANGYVKYVNGFRRLIPPDFEDRGRQKRQAVNSCIQGPASDLGVSAMINTQLSVHRAGMHAKLYQFVHDSIGHDTPPGEVYDLFVIIQKAMEIQLARQWSFVTVPLKVEFELGASWGTLMETKIEKDLCNHLRIKGKKKNFDLLLGKFSEWDPDIRPIVHDVKEEVKQEVAVIRSLMRSSSFDEMVSVPYVDALVEFPRGPRRVPTYTRCPLVE